MTENPTTTANTAEIAVTEEVAADVSTEVEGTVVCYECGKRMSEDTDESTLINDVYYCDTCRDACFVECASCQEWEPRASCRDFDGEVWCDSCIAEYTFTCDRCDNLHHVDDAHTAVSSSGSGTERMYCTGCFENHTFCCSNCNESCYGDSCGTADGDVCEVCYSDHYRYCEDCDESFHEDSGCNCPEEEEEEEEDRPMPTPAPTSTLSITISGSPRTDGARAGNWYNQRNEPEVGPATDRFSVRTVGVEMETGSGADGQRFLQDFFTYLPGWGVKSDGSLRNGGREFVSPPIGGAFIQGDLERFYAMANHHGVNVRDQHAGGHVHVHAGDIYERVTTAYRDAMTEQGKSLYASRSLQDAVKYADPASRAVNFREKAIRRVELLEDTIQEFGNSITDLVRQIVGRARLENSYCRGDFAIRGNVHRALMKAKEGGYPAVAIRDHTFEFRIFPSTQNVEDHLAKIELVQKSVDWLATVAAEPNSKIRAKMLKAFREMVDKRTIEKWDEIAGLFGISPESLTMLKSLFNAHGADFWRWNEQQVERRRQEELRRQERERQERERAIREAAAREERERLLAQSNEMWAAALAERERLQANPPAPGERCPHCGEVHATA